jgi:uncharacterized protein (TIGR02145 family)
MKNTLLLLLTISCFNSQSQITDIDGNSYDTVRIGNQTWMSENLNVSHFRNGDTIPEAKTDEDWVKASENEQPAWCYYDNDPANGAKYGKLFNWYAVNDSRGLAPNGYHIPSDAEWTKLTDFLGGEEFAGTKMKSKSGWAENGNGTNTSSFSGLPGGGRNSYGNFSFVGHYGVYWSSTEHGKDDAWLLFLFDNLGYGYKNNGHKQNGHSVRCLRD